MAYADQQMSGNKITALIIVALIHVAVGYALVTGLAYSAAKQILKKVTTVDIKEPEKPKEPPPPPPKQDTPPPPVVAPPVKVDIAPAAPVIETVQAPPPVPPPPVYIPPAPAAPPPPRFTPKSAAPKGNPANWATSNDYPSRALREEREGTTGFRVTVGTDGKVTDCQITSSSGTPELDAATCDNVRRRARFTPATDGEGNPTTGTYANRIRWVIPKD
ncbi:energy transducer TonB [Novosphingobium flavum]|uniref:Energy transducer TonB n=1 Tax=Novosphingobium aerophilum TaxID=2839843 RepID=A0A7X1FBF0_9SPHN|nr:MULTISPECIES: energy transducer TonB [Novosphingobium]MBC2653444.1 energy transducer TonB [Novosphingobium aerophilum]MBC2662363.1 energy transducer TonB [Novosphingobium aerophilum]